MNAALDFNQTIQHLIQTCLSMNKGAFDLNRNQFKSRLQVATSFSFDPEAANSWRNRRIILARLRRYAAYNDREN
jgi:hypothetical protein